MNTDTIKHPEPKPSQAYVVGLMFSNDLSQVALIRKNKPAWQAGKLNGVGGKVEKNEPPYVSMIREFAEETGLLTTRVQWKRFLKMGGENDGGDERFHIDFFATVGDLSLLQSMEAEKIEIAFTSEIHALRTDVIENLPWIVALAVDFLQDGRPGAVTAEYYQS
jgi:8-oxo-dGTP diphosphatase